jgi:hypothetical protein
MQKNRKKRIGSLGKIRTSNPSVNSGRGGKSKCRVWCRLQKNGAIFPALVAPNAAPKPSMFDRTVSLGVPSRQFDLTLPLRLSSPAVDF